MSISDAVLDHLRVAPGHAANLEHRDTGWADGLKRLSGKGHKQEIEAALEESREEIDQAQELLWAADTRSRCSSSRPWTPRARTARSSTSWRA
jgi:hypothetical protein